MVMTRRFRHASVLVALLLLLQIAQTTHVHVLRGAMGQQPSIAVDDDASSCLLCWAMQGTASAPPPAQCSALSHAFHAVALVPVTVHAVVARSSWAPRGPPLS